MNRAAKRAAFAAVVGGIVATGAAASPSQDGNVRSMKPGHGVSLTVGGKHVVSYFLADRGGCALTVVMADTDFDGTTTESPGTRFTAQVGAGARTQIDVAQGKTAEFVCAADGTKMTSRVFERLAYSAK